MAHARGGAGSLNAATHERPARPRLFFALDLAPTVRAALGRWRDAATASRGDLRPVPEEALHVTLAFLGATPEESIEAVAACGLEAAWRRPAPVLEPGEVRALPRRAPRLFALDLTEEGGAAAEVQATVVGALADAGLLEPERRPFWPHLTLARVRGGAGGRAKGGRVAPLELPPPPVHRLTCQTVTLYRSHLSPRGARYEPLGHRKLRPPS